MISKEDFCKIVDFGHRLQPINAYDNLIPSIKRAKAIGDLLEIAAIDDIDAETLRYAGQAIRMEMTDAEAILKAYWKNLGSQKNPR